MIYNEINLINTNYILPYSPIVENIEYCARDEIADPYKLNVLINIDSSKWSVYEHNNKFFYSTLVPWNKKYNSYGIEIESHYFRVLTQDPSIFNINFNDIDTWFDKNYSKLFLITHVILSHVVAKESNTVYKRQRIPDKKYVTYKKQLISLNNIERNSNEEMDKILENKCYTICNGIILLIALHRLNYINIAITKTNLEKLAHDEFRISFETNHNNEEEHDADDADDADDDGDDAAEENELAMYNNDINNIFRIEKVKADIDYIQHVNNDWEEFYYAFPLAQLCDYPIYYTQFGPNFVDANIYKLFSGFEDSHIIHHHTQNIYSYPITAQFPYFNINSWNNYLNNNKRYHTIISTMDDFMNPNIEIPDITNDYAGILQMFYNTSIGWNYWTLNKNDIITRLFSINCKECYKFLKVAFHYYRYENINNRRRICSIWEDILNIAFVNNNSGNILNVTCLLYIYYTVYVSSHSILVGINDNNKINPPLEFIKYILSKCKNTHIYFKNSISGIAQENIRRKIKIIFPNTVFNDDENKYTITTSLYSLIRLYSNHYEYLQKIISTRLLCLKYFTDNHEIYTVVTAYIKNNRELLF